MTIKTIRFLSLIGLIFIIITSFFVGVLDLNVGGILDGDSVMLHTLFYSRVPRTLSIILAASSLSMAGFIMQQISANPFVSPQTAITSDAIKLGVLIALIFGFGNNFRILIGITVGFIATLLFLRVLKSLPLMNMLYLPLFGIIIGNIIDAITNLIALKFDLIQPLNAIFSKGFTSIFKGDYEIMAINIVFMIVTLLLSRYFLIMSMGDHVAINLGINMRFISNLALLIVSVLSGITILTVGNIPFVGLLIPNIVLRYVDISDRWLHFDIIVMSSLFLLVCDIVSRIVIFPYEIPISLVTGIIGASFFIWILIRGKNHES